MITTIPWAPGAQYVHLTCRLGEPRPDSSDPDEYVDLMTQGGTVVLSCAAKRLKYLEEDGRHRMLTMRDWSFTIREADGEFYNPESGNVGVYILSSLTEGLDPTGFTWTATITPASGPGWSVTIPADATGDFDLVEASEGITPSGGWTRQYILAPADPGGVGYVLTTNGAGDPYWAPSTGGGEGGGGGTDTEAVQDIVGAMVAQAGGTYNDAAGTITLPAGEGAGPDSLEGLPDGTTRLAMTTTERSKLSSVASGATANATNAQLRDRSTHTGAQAISTVTGLQAALNDKAATSAVMNLPAISNYVPLWVGTRTEYEALTTPDADTVHFIVEG